MNDVLLNPALPSRRMSVTAGTILFDAPDSATNLYIIHRGQVRLHQLGPEGATRLVDILGPNDWFGTNALLQGAPYGVRATTVTASVVTQVPAERLLALLATHPKASVELLRQLAAKLRNAREDAARLVFDDCNQRLIKTLVRFSRSAAASPQPDGVVLHITHHQLAEAIGVARETVSLALTQLRHQNLLRTGRNRLTFNPEALRSFLKQPSANGNGAAEPAAAEAPEAVATVG